MAPAVPTSQFLADALVAKRILCDFLNLFSCFCDVVYDVGCNESRVLRIDT